MVKTRQIVECVPNFSEGRDKAVIKQITDVIEQSGGVKLTTARIRVWARQTCCRSCR